MLILAYLLRSYEVESTTTAEERAARGGSKWWSDVTSEFDAPMVQSDAGSVYGGDLDHGRAVRMQSKMTAEDREARGDSKWWNQAPQPTPF